ncbi:hypothetical protein NUACC21_09960 [Scytonema sp. NUACC21]
MHNHTQFIKKFVGSFLGMAGISTIIAFPGIGQANINSGSSSNSNQPILVQNSPGTSKPAPGSTNGTRSQANNLDQQFVTQAAQSDLTEIQTSRLALQRSQNQAVRKYAQRMIQEHTSSSKQLTQIAQQKKLQLPKDIGSDNRALVSQLGGLKGTDFDQAYMQGQVASHTKTLANYQNYLQQGNDPQLKAFASKVAPLVADHLEMAQNMAQGTGNTGSGTPGNTAPGSRTPGNTAPGSGTPGNTAPGSRTPGSTAPGSGTPGSTAPGSGTPGSTAPDSGR